MFCGTQDKCAVCSKTAYPLEKVCHIPETYTCTIKYNQEMLKLKVIPVTRRFLWKGRATTKPASSALMEGVPSRHQTMLRWMAFCTASTTLHSCSRRRGATTTWSRLIPWSSIRGILSCHQRLCWQTQQKISQSRSRRRSQQRLKLIWTITKGP